MTGPLIALAAAFALASSGTETPYRFSPEVSVRGGIVRVVWSEALPDGSRRARAADWDGAAWRAAPASKPSVSRRAPGAGTSPESVAWLGERACFVEGVGGVDARLRVEGSTVGPSGVPLGPLAADASRERAVAAWIARVGDERQTLVSAEWSDGSWKMLETPSTVAPSEPIVVVAGKKSYLAWSGRDRDGTRRIAVAALEAGVRAWALLPPPTRSASHAPRCAARASGVCCVWEFAGRDGGRIGAACLESGHWRALSDIPNGD